MINAIYLPKLNNLRPTMESTLLKIMEEAGELSRAVLKFLPFEAEVSGRTVTHPLVSKLLNDVAEELLDVAQTCVTMIFVMEESHGIQADELIDTHLRKLIAKGYYFDGKRQYRISTAGNFKYLHLPRLVLDGVTLLTTVCKIQEELGELTQYLGKYAGASGERQEFPAEEILIGCALELLDVAQCCFTMMYILSEKYEVDVPAATRMHTAKLKLKGYYV